MFDNTNPTEIASQLRKRFKTEPRFLLVVLVVVLVAAVIALLLGWAGLVSTVPVPRAGPG